MPIPANWLEELVIEWLDLDGFLISTSISVPAKGGGRIAPDAVGAKRDENGDLLVVHCEVSMFLIDGPEKMAQRYAQKFSQKVETEVRNRLGKIFNICEPDRIIYRKVIITFQASKNVLGALRDVIPDVEIRFLKKFILNNVLTTVRKWRDPPHTKATAMPADKWLLDLIDRFRRYGLLTNE